MKEKHHREDVLDLLKNNVIVDLYKKIHTLHNKYRQFLFFLTAILLYFFMNTKLTGNDISIFGFCEWICLIISCTKFSVISGG